MTNSNPKFSSEEEYEVKTLLLKDAKIMIGLTNAAYSDYEAARVLFLQLNYPNACSLGCTAIEKMIKAILLYHNSKFKWIHDISNLLEKLEAVAPQFKGLYNKDFFKALTNIYEWRYIGEKEPGYNFTILEKKFLAELDYTFHDLQRRIRFNQGTAINGIPKSRYDMAIENKDPRIITKNHIYLQIPKSKFITGRDKVLEVRIASTFEIFEISYDTDESKDDGIFTFELMPETRSETQISFGQTHPFSKDIQDALDKIK